MQLAALRCYGCLNPARKPPPKSCSPRHGLELSSKSAARRPTPSHRSQSIAVTWGTLQLCVPASVACQCALAASWHYTCGSGLWSYKVSSTVGCAVAQSLLCMHELGNRALDDENAGPARHCSCFYQLCRQESVCKQLLCSAACGKKLVTRTFKPLSIGSIFEAICQSGLVM